MNYYSEEQIVSAALSVGIADVKSLLEALERGILVDSRERVLFHGEGEE